MSIYSEMKDEIYTEELDGQSSEMHQDHSHSLEEVLLFTTLYLNSKIKRKQPSYNTQLHQLLVQLFQSL